MGEQTTALGIPLQGPLFHVEHFIDIMAELPPLFYQHWKEVALEQGKIKLAPNWPLYCELERNGLLLVYTVRVGPKLAGYYFCRVSNALHYLTSLQSYQDIYYLVPEARGCFKAFVAFIEADLKSRGVQKTYIMRKLHTKKAAAHDRMLRSMGYKPIEIWYSKMLED